MNWFTLSTLALFLYIASLLSNYKTKTKKTRIIKLVLFCVATICLGMSAITKIKEALIQNNTGTLTLESIIIVVCVVFLGIGIAGLKKQITNNQDSQKGVFFSQQKKQFLYQQHQ